MFEINKLLSEYSGNDILNKSDNKKVFVVNGSEYDSSWTGLEYTKIFDAANLVVFTGGQDINPNLYRESCNTLTYFTVERDALEVYYWQKAVKEGKFIVGICRGAQLICALSNGKLIQDVTGHAGMGGHIVTFKDGSLINCISIHHQMMYPYNLPKNEYDILGWMNTPRSKHYYGGTNENMELPEDFVEPEIVWFPKTQSLGIQSHPEMMDNECTFDLKCKELLLKYMNNEIKV